MSHRQAFFWTMVFIVSNWSAVEFSFAGEPPSLFTAIEPGGEATPREAYFEIWRADVNSLAVRDPELRIRVNLPGEPEFDAELIRFKYEEVTSRWKMTTAIRTSSRTPTRCPKSLPGAGTVVAKAGPLR